MAQDGSQPNDRGKKSREPISAVSGTLYIVGTPIGHPDDLSIRALAVLHRVALIASEDPRVTQRLLTHHAIRTTLTSYGPLNRHEKVLLLLHRLKQGEDIALVSDNGTPVIYDPGCLLVAAAHDEGIPVTAIPGPSAVTAATAISGFSGDAIIFEGHLPSTSLRLRKYLAQFRLERKTLAFYVIPEALRRLLYILEQVLPTRQIAIAANLTTCEETLLRGKPKELLRQIRRISKGSALTVVIEGSTEEERTNTTPRLTRPRGGE